MTTKPYINLQTDLLKKAIDGPFYRKVFRNSIQDMTYYGIIQDNPGAMYLIPEVYYWMESIPLEPKGLEFVFDTITKVLDDPASMMAQHYGFFDIKQITKKPTATQKAETFLTFSDAYYNSKLFKPLGPLTDHYMFIEFADVRNNKVIKQLLVVNTGSIPFPIAYILPTRIGEEEE